MRLSRRVVLRAIGAASLAPMVARAQPANVIRQAPVPDGDLFSAFA